MRKIAPLFALIALAATLGAGHLLLSNETPTPEAEVARTAAPTSEAPRHRTEAPLTAPAPQAVPTELRLEAGQWWRYSLTSSHEALGSEALDMSGSVEVRCYKVLDDGGYLLGERYALQSTSAQFHALAEQSSHELLLEVDRQGQLKRLALPETTPDARNMLRALVISRQVVLPTEVSERWQAFGEDTTGRFVAEYRTEDEQVVRARAYESLHGTVSAAAVVSIEGELGGLLHADGRAHTWAGEEVITVGAPSMKGGTSDSLSVRSRYGYAMVAKGRFSDPESALASAEGRLGPAAWSSEIAGELNGARHSAPMRPLDVVLNELATLSARGDSEEFTTRGPALFIELRERLMRDPTAIAQAGLVARARGGDLRFRATVIDALGSAGTAPAQRELLTLRTEVEDELLSSVYLGLAETTSPLPETLTTLRDEGRAAGVRRDHARRAIGWLASRVSSPKLKGTLALELEDSLGEDADSDQILLEALGNAGQERSLPALESYLDADDEDTRAVAASALRKLGA